MADAPVKAVYVDGAARSYPYCGEVLARLPAGTKVVDLPEGELPPGGRATLFITTRKGPFLKECPCTPGAVECGYRVFSPLMGCPYACSYCFLRFYAPDEPLTLFANFDEGAAEFRAWAATVEKPARVGTGEFADSLALDHLTGHAAKIAALVADFPNVLMELKTKSGDPSPLLALPPLPNLIGAWSVNPPGLAKEQEHFAAPVEERIAAAAKVAAEGRPVAFHFDPIILSPGWEEGYAALARAIFAAVPPELVRWISLGTLRFPRRFVDANAHLLRSDPLFFEEFVAGADGKLRYFWPERSKVYRRVAGALREAGGGFARLYLCMEPAAMWESALGVTPEERPVERLFW